MLLTCDAIDASGIIVWMLFLHMYFQRLLIFVMPIALGTFEGFAAVSSRIPSNAAGHPGTIEYHVTIGAFNSSLSAIYMIWAGSNSGTRHGGFIVWASIGSKTREIQRRLGHAGGRGDR